MLDRIKRFLSGVNFFSPESFRNLKFPEIVRYRYKEIPFSNLFLLDEALRILWEKKAVYSIEIWKEEDFEFYISSSKFEKLGELGYRLSAAYPDPKIEYARKAFPQARGYMAAGFLRLEGGIFGLKTLEDFDHDPLTHILSVSRNPCIIQFLFRPERTVIETFLGDFPVFRLRVAVAVFSEKWKEAKEECEMILRSFSVFNGISRLKPVMPSALRSSNLIFKGIALRKFLFKDSFKITLPSLIAIVHFPLRGEE